MKKIININLSGRVIPIEDTAYEKLQDYIESLRRYFANEESRDEIINDIESRIAELMNEKVRKGASNITDADVDEIAGYMGRPEDFEAEEKTEPAQQAGQQQYHEQSEQQYHSTKTKKGRLYRDASDKFVGGVCSGIAAYLNVDPTIVRLLFAIITFGGFGLGFLAYIILWVILPTKDLEGYAGKRLYRNPDDKVIAGVAGGLAAYFDKSTSTIRLIFAAPILLSILLSFFSGFGFHNGPDLFLNIGSGSLSGTFMLVYIILWIVLPEANTTYEKMEMRGEKVDVNRIRQNVREGMDNMKDKMKGWSEEVKESAQQFSTKAKAFSSTRGKEFATEVNETVRRSTGGIGHAIGVLFKAFFLFIAGTIAFAIFVSLIALLFGGIAWWPVNNFLWTSKWQQLYAWGTLIFFLIIPLVALIMWVVRRIIRARSGSHYLGWTFGALWTFGWVCLVLFITSISKDFREYEHIDTTVTINQPATGKMIVAVSEPIVEYTGRFDWFIESGDGWDVTTDTLKLSIVKFNIEASTDDQYHVVMKKEGYGSTSAEARVRAENIQYAVRSIDSVLDVASGYAINSTNKFRGQQIEIEIMVPIGKKIVFDESVRGKLNPVRFNVRKNKNRRRVVGIQFDEDNSFNYRSGIVYTMGVDGNLKDESGQTMNNSNSSTDYRYESNDSLKRVKEAQELQRLLEQEKIIKEESEKRIKELEQKKNEIKSTTFQLNIKTDSINRSTASILSPVSTLVL